MSLTLAAGDTFLKQSIFKWKYAADFVPDFFLSPVYLSVYVLRRNFRIITSLGGLL